MPIQNSLAPSWRIPAAPEEYSLPKKLIDVHAEVAQVGVDCRRPVPEQCLKIWQGDLLPADEVYKAHVTGHDWSIHDGDDEKS